jgi:O-antigen ligase
VEFLARQELIRVLVYGALFYAILNNLHRQETTQIVGLTLIFLAMAISIYAIYQFLTTSDYTWNLYKPEGYRKRGSGTFINPNNLAGYLEMVLPLALAFTLIGRFEPTSKIFLGYASLVIFAGIASTISRGGWLATGVGLAVLYLWLLRQRDYWKRALVALGVFAVIFLIFLWKAEMPPERHERFEVARQVEDVRFQLWKPSAAIWKDHLWFGAGPAHFDYRFRQYRPADPRLQSRPDRVHNDYLNTLVDWGLVGAVLILACWATFYYQVLRGWRFVQRSQNDLGARRSNKSAFVAGGSIGLLAILVHSLFDFNMHIPANALLTVALLALVASHYRFASERYWHTVRWPLRIPVICFLLCGLGYLSLQSWKRTQEAYWLTKGAKAEVADNSIAAFKRAWSADSLNFETAYKIGEAYRLRSWEGGEGYRSMAQEATNWFQKSMDLNAYNPHPWIRSGMCLDWLGEHTEAENYFEQAKRIDPNSYYTEAHLGWHYFQREDYATAKRHFERSLSLMTNQKINPIPHFYLRAVEEHLAKASIKG